MCLWHLLIWCPYSMGRSNRQLWKAYVEGRATGNQTTAKVQQKVSLGKFRGHILGIDPSLRGTGIAIVEFSEGNEVTLRHCETIRNSAKLTSTECLGNISERCEWLLENFKIHHVAVEQTIYVQNFRTAMILGTAKGAALGILARAGLEVFEYPPLRVKQAIVGNGRASKEQVAEMVTRFTGYDGWSSADETDAAGVALCHGFTHRV